MLYSKYGKRCFDLALTIPGVLIIFPALVLLALLPRIRPGRPVPFNQARPGLHGKPFTLYKFRTMTDAMDEKGSLLPDAKRLTRLGRFLRMASLDELPELWNVLRGDMSLVGPRAPFDEEAVVSDE
jgi:sugar transferase EpsL